MIEGVEINWDAIPVSSPVIKLVHVANFNELNAVNVVGKLMCCIVFACYVGFGKHKLMRVHKKAILLDLVCVTQKPSAPQRHRRAKFFSF